MKKYVAKRVLSNGLVVLVRRSGVVPRVSTQLWYNVGSKDEQSGEHGVAHLIEHMIFKGTKRLSESDINLVTHKLSGSCNAFTSNDYTGYLFDFPSHNWREGLGLMADCMNNCTFKDELLNSELAAVIQELKMYRDDYVSTLAEDMASSIFSDHPYRNPIIGYKRELLPIARETLVNFYKRYYTPNNAALVVVGDVDEEEVFNLAEKNFGSIKPGPELERPDIRWTEDVASKSITIYRDVKQPVMLCSLVIPGLKSKKAHAIDVISFMLGSSRTSRLRKLLVDDLALAAEADSFVYDMADYGLLFVYVRPVKVENIDKIRQAISDEIRSIGEKGFNKDEISRGANRTRVDYLAMLESNHKQAYAIGKDYTVVKDENFAFEYLKDDETLFDEISDLSKNFIRPSVVHHGLVLPFEGQDKERWVCMQGEEGRRDIEVLSKRARKAPVEPGVYVHTVKPGVPEKFEFPKAESFALDNGLKVLWHSNKAVPTVDIALELKSKSDRDPEDKQGLYSFVCEMIREGTKNYTSAQLTNALEEKGMSLSVSSGFVSIRALSKDIKAALTFLLEVVKNASMEKNAVERVRERALSDVKSFWDDPADFVGQLAKEAVYKNHPYSKNSFGTKDGLEKIVRDDLVNFYAKSFVPDGAKLALVGDFEGIDVEKICREVLSSWTGPKVEDMVYPVLIAPERKIITHPIDRDQTVMCITGLSVSREDPKLDGLILFDQILTGGVLGGMNSRLFQLREQSGLFYTIGGSVVSRPTKQPGMVYIRTIVSQDRVSEAELAIRATMAACGGTILPEELQQAKDAIVNTIPSNFESNARTAVAFLFIERYGLPSDYFDKRGDVISAVSMQDVLAAAEDIVKNDKLVTILAGRE